MLGLCGRNRNMCCPQNGRLIRGGQPPRPVEKDLRRAGASIRAAKGARLGGSVKQAVRGGVDADGAEGGACTPPIAERT